MSIYAALAIKDWRPSADRVFTAPIADRIYRLPGPVMRIYAPRRTCARAHQYKEKLFTRPSHSRLRGQRYRYGAGMSADFGC